MEPPSTERPSQVDYWQLNEMPKNGCQKNYMIHNVSHRFLHFWGKTIWGNHGNRAKSKRERRYQVQKIEYSKSIITRKENVIVSFYHNTLYTAVLSYAITMMIRIYSVIPIYLWFSKTEGLAGLLWVIGLSVLEKTNLICFQTTSLVLSKVRYPS